MNRSEVVLLYGDTGTGKTAQIGQAAAWEHAQTGGVTRLISADSGWDPIEHLMIGPNGGCVEAFNIQYLKNPLPVLIDLSEGAWPEVVNGPDGKPKLRMVKPTFDASGQLVSSTGAPVTQYAIEGISTLGDMLLQDHIRQQRKIGQDVVGTFTDAVQEWDGTRETTKTVSFAKASPSHYGQVQDFILLDLVPRFGALPVNRVIWTGHEAKGDDDVTGTKGSVLGPATVGKAAVARTARKFGEYLHMTVNNTIIVDPRTKVPELKQDYRAWFVPHADDVLTRMQWPAKVSLSLARMAELHKVWPAGYIPLTPTSGVETWLAWKAGK